MLALHSVQSQRSHSHTRLTMHAVLQTREHRATLWVEREVQAVCNLKELKLLQALVLSAFRRCAASDETAGAGDASAETAAAASDATSASNTNSTKGASHGAATLATTTTASSHDRSHNRASTATRNSKHKLRVPRHPGARHGRTSGAASSTKLASTTGGGSTPAEDAVQCTGLLQRYPAQAELVHRAQSMTSYLRRMLGDRTLHFCWELWYVQLVQQFIHVQRWREGNSHCFMRCCVVRCFVDSQYTMGTYDKLVPVTLLPARHTTAGR